MAKSSGSKSLDESSLRLNGIRWDTDNRSGRNVERIDQFGISVKDRPPQRRVLVELVGHIVGAIPLIPHVKREAP